MSNWLLFLGITAACVIILLLVTKSQMLYWHVHRSESARKAQEGEYDPSKDPSLRSGGTD